MVENPKPAPDIFLYAAKQMGEPTDATWVIEDSSTGMRAGVAAGMRTFGLQHHVNKEQIVQIGAEPIDSLGEFIQILSSAL
jgi:beta-phosphoglucomutase-like phosphatase (HAD superfamily)